LVYTSPIHGNGIAVAMGGFFGNIMAVKTGGKGDVTQTHRLWMSERTKAGIGSGVIRDGISISLARMVLRAVPRAEDGKSVWSERAKGPGPSRTRGLLSFWPATVFIS
jgi:hypothetical protein